MKPFPSVVSLWQERVGHIAVLLDSLLGKPRGFSDWAEGLIDE